MTALLSATGFLASWALVAATGSRTAGGLLLLAFALPCVAIWRRRDGHATAAKLAGAGVAAFVVSHVLGLLIGSWPAVIVVAAGMAATSWRLSDSATRREARPRPARA